MKQLATLAAASTLCLAALPSERQYPQPPPRSRAGVEAVVLDVSVLDREGRPVRGLTRSDFTVLEDGHPQELMTVTAVDGPDPRDLPPAGCAT
jgi:hypothetical protein